MYFQFKFNLYYEVKRVSLEDEPLKEMDGKKRLWMKDEGMSSEIYSQHLKPTIFNTDIKILTTEVYIPEYLKEICYTGNYNFVPRPRFRRI